MTNVPITIDDAWFGDIDAGAMTGVTKEVPPRSIVDWVQGICVHHDGDNYYIRVPGNLTNTFYNTTPNPPAYSYTLGIGLYWVQNPSGGEPSKDDYYVLRFPDTPFYKYWKGPNDSANSMYVYDGNLFKPTRYRMPIEAAYFGVILDNKGQTPWDGDPPHNRNEDTQLSSNKALDQSPIHEYMQKYCTGIDESGGVFIQCPLVCSQHFEDVASALYVKKLDFYYRHLQWLDEPVRHALVGDTEDFEKAKKISNRSCEVRGAWYGNDDKKAFRWGVTKDGTKLEEFIEDKWRYGSTGYSIPAGFESSMCWNSDCGGEPALHMHVHDNIKDKAVFLVFNTGTGGNQTWTTNKQWSSIHNLNSDSYETSGPLVPDHRADIMVRCEDGYAAIYLDKEDGSKHTFTAADDKTSISEYMNNLFIHNDPDNGWSVTIPYSMNTHFGDPHEGHGKKLQFQAVNPKTGEKSKEKMRYDEKADCGKEFFFASGVHRDPNTGFECENVTQAWTDRKKKCDGNVSNTIGQYMNNRVAQNQSTTWIKECPQGKPTVSVLVSGGGWRALHSSAQFFDMLKHYEMMGKVSSVSGVSGGSWATALALMTGDKDRFWNAQWTDEAPSPNIDALPPGLVEMLSKDRADAAFASVLGGATDTRVGWYAVMGHLVGLFPVAVATAAAIGLADNPNVAYYPKFILATTKNDSRTFLGNSTVLLGRQFGLIKDMKQETGIALSQHPNVDAPIGFMAAINGKWYAFDGVLENASDAASEWSQAMGGLMEVGGFDRTSLNKAEVAKVNYLWTKYPARQLDASAVLAICGSAGAKAKSVLQFVDGEGFAGTVHPMNGKDVQLWDAGIDINVPFPLATGYVQSVGRPDICLVLDCSEHAQNVMSYPDNPPKASQLQKAIKEGWYQPHSGYDEAKWFGTGFAKGEVRVYYPRDDSPYPVIIYGFGDVENPTVMMSWTEEELKKQRRSIGATAANMQDAYQHVEARISAPSSGYEVFNGVHAVSEPAPQAPTTPEQLPVYSLDLYGFLFADEIAVYLSNPCLPLGLQHEISLECLFKGPRAARALTIKETDEKDLADAMIAFLLWYPVENIPLRLAQTWANRLGARIDKGDVDGEISGELLNRTLNDGAVPSGSVPQFRAWVLILLAHRCIQRALPRLKGAIPPKSDRVVEFLAHLEKQNLPKNVLHFDGASSTPLKDLSSLLKPRPGQKGS